jgi:hypothetical protein
MVTTPIAVGAKQNTTANLASRTSCLCYLFSSALQCVAEHRAIPCCVSCRMRCQHALWVWAMALARTECLIDHTRQQCDQSSNLCYHCRACCGTQACGNAAVTCGSIRQRCEHHDEEQHACNWKVINSEQGIAALSMMHLATAKVHLLYVHACTVVDLTQVRFL